MINWEKFDENFKHYGDDVMVQIIDMFIDDHRDDLKLIEQAILNRDYAGIKFNAHHLKGSVATFMDAHATELLRKLEEMGDMKVDAGISDVFISLKSALNSLLQELLMRRNLAKAQ